MINNFLNIPLFTKASCNECQIKKTIWRTLIKSVGVVSGVGLVGYLGSVGVMAVRKQYPQVLIVKKKVGGKLGKNYQGGFDKKMNKQEACLILSIVAKSNLKELREAHKRLMLLNHPDNGGSTYIASKINQAKDILMLHIKQYKH
jgi:DnaJ family protein C protein 19